MDGITTVVDQPCEPVVRLVAGAVAEQGFEVLRELNPSEALYSRMGVEMPHG